jgi:hypothetical protein
MPQGVICLERPFPPKCYPLYYLPRRRWWEPDPDPRFTGLFGRLRGAFEALFGRRSPSPWRNADLLKSGATEETLRNASVLGAMAVMAESLSPGVRGNVVQLLDGTIAQLPLPKGVVVR